MCYCQKFLIGYFAMKSPLGEYRFVPSFFRSPNSSVTSSSSLIFFFPSCLSLLAFILLYSGVLSWSSVSLRRFIAPFDRSSQFDRSVKCIRTKLSRATVSNNLDSAYECIAKVGLFDLFLLDWRIRNESNLRNSKSCGTNHETNISSQFVVFYTPCRAPVYLFIKSGSDFGKWVFKFSL